MVSESGVAMSPIVASIKRICDDDALTIATAESVTAGGIAHRLTSVSGASTFYMGGVVVYTLKSKVELLGVDEDEARKCNCVSAEIAEQMAYNTRVKFGVSIGIAITGYAEPYQSIARPYAWVGFSVNGHTWSECIETDANSRDGVREDYINTVLDGLLSLLKEMQ